MLIGFIFMLIKINPMPIEIFFISIGFSDSSKRGQILSYPK